jgi:hypothetical protein
LAEELAVVGFAGSPGSATWLPAEDAEALLGLPPAGNVAPEQRAELLRHLVERAALLTHALEAQAADRARDLAATHRRVRRDAGASSRVTVRPHLPVDVLGLYLYLPPDMAPRSPFVTITTEGGLLSTDLLARLARQPTTVSGTSADDYHLPPGRRLRDAINRSWTELQGAWSTYAAELATLPSGERATTITRERWLLPLFAELGFGRLQRTNALSINGRDYPISHLWGAVPIHLLGADVELDRRTRGVAGAASAAPFSMVQELLNRSEDHLWAILSNGRRLRLLRDNTSLTRAAYVEFDLEAMFSDQVFTDFAVLWMACHESRFEADQPAHCWLERWIDEARQQGVRALDTLRTGFERAITALGSGFLAHPANAALRDRLRHGELAADDYHRQVLRLVYRLVFLLVAEDRDLFHPPDASDEARRRYARYYSLGRIRDHARRHRGGRHVDLFASLRPVIAALGGDGLPAIGVPALGSFLWSPNACPDLDGAALSNSDLLDAVCHLAYTDHDHTLQRVDFANLGPEELGSVYESLLELHPRLELDAARFELVSVAGSERKSTGSCYTPTALISALLDQALDPLLNEAQAAPDPTAAILAIKVLDPACGSGHFLTAAARRIATRLAAAHVSEPGWSACAEPTAASSWPSGSAAAPQNTSPNASTSSSGLWRLLPCQISPRATRTAAPSVDHPHPEQPSADHPTAPETQVSSLSRCRRRVTSQSCQIHPRSILPNRCHPNLPVTPIFDAGFSEGRCGRLDHRVELAHVVLLVGHLGTGDHLLFVGDRLCVVALDEALGRRDHFGLGVGRVDLLLLGAGLVLWCLGLPATQLRAPSFLLGRSLGEMGLMGGALVLELFVEHLNRKYLRE